MRTRDSTSKQSTTPSNARASTGRWPSSSRSCARIRNFTRRRRASCGRIRRTSRRKPTGSSRRRSERFHADVTGFVQCPTHLAPIYTGGRGGLESCLMNAYTLSARPLYTLASLTLHECTPGHSFQAALALEGPQALAYELGEIQIRRHRAEAEEKLGSAFDQRKFHDAIFALGSVPLPVLEQRMTQFISDGGK